jgi:hypothetical protein
MTYAEKRAEQFRSRRIESIKRYLKEEATKDRWEKFENYLMREILENHMLFRHDELREIFNCFGKDGAFQELRLAEGLFERKFIQFGGKVEPIFCYFRGVALHHLGCDYDALRWLEEGISIDGAVELRDAIRKKHNFVPTAPKKDDQREIEREARITRNVLISRPSDWYSDSN